MENETTERGWHATPYDSINKTFKIISPAGVESQTEFTEPEAEFFVSQCEDADKLASERKAKEEAVEILKAFLAQVSYTGTMDFVNCTELAKAFLAKNSK